MISVVEKGKLFIYKYSYWLFAVGVGFIVVLFEDVEPVFSILFFLYVLTLVLWGAAQVLRQAKTVIQLKSEQAKTELIHLQSQVSPHFFFNTLNNLYGLIDKDTLKAKEMILTLSNMMRYSIYDGQKEHVTLEEEVAYLQSYISLHQARYHKKNTIRFEFEVEDEGLSLTPLLFIILVENAFKHGVENLREGAYVYIHLNANTNEISFSIENNFDATELSSNQGIGLTNLKRRLELVYPKKHLLNCTVSENIYKAQLTLKSK